MLIQPQKRLSINIAALMILSLLVAAQEIGHLGIDTDPAPLVQAKRPVRRASSPATTRPDRGGPPATSGSGNPSLASQPVPPVGGAVGNSFADVMMRADAASQAQKYPAAIEGYLKATSMKPDSVEARLGLAEAFLDSRRFQDAEREFRQVLSSNSAAAEAQRGLGDTLYELRRYKDAVAAYGSSEQAGIKDAELYNNYANALFRTGTTENRRRAIDAYRKAIALKPAWSSAYAGLANLLRSGRRGDPTVNLAEALTMATKAVELDSNSALAHSILGRVYADQKDFAKAQAEGERAVQLSPNDPFVYINLGGINFAQGRAADAEKAYQKAISLDKRWAFSYHSLGTLYLQQGKLGEASTMFSQAVLFEPNSPTLRTSFGAARARSGDYNEAINQIREALRIDPNYVAAHHNLGTIYAVQKNYPEAAKEFQQAATLDPSNYDYFVALGDVYKLMGKKSESDAAYARAESLGWKSSGKEAGGKGSKDAEKDSGKKKKKN